MKKINTWLKNEIKNYYAESTSIIDAHAKELTIRLVEESAAKRQRWRSIPSDIAHIPFWRFTLEQLKFIQPRIWILQLIVLVGMFASVIGCGTREGGMPIVMSAAVLSVVLGIPGALKSFEYRVSELEYSCMHNCMQVLTARLVLFGLADVLWITLAVATIPSLTGVDGLRVFLYAATPFFCCCAVSFYTARITRGDSQVVCLAAAGLSVLALWGLSVALPHWYTNLSLATWITAFGCAVALATHEAHRLMGQVADGFLPRASESAR